MPSRQAAPIVCTVIWATALRFVARNKALTNRWREIRGKEDKIYFPAYEETVDFHQTLFETFTPATAGIAINMMLAKLTSKLHPGIRVASITIIPFVSNLYVESKTSKAPFDLMGQYHRMFQPRSYDEFRNLNPPEPQQQIDPNCRPYKGADCPKTDPVDYGPQKVNKIKELLPLFGRTMVYAQRMSILALNQFCLPKRTGNTWESSCEPIFTDKDDNSWFYRALTHEELIMDSCKEAFPSLPDEKTPPPS